MIVSYSNARRHHRMLLPCDIPWNATVSTESALPPHRTQTTYLTPSIVMELLSFI